MDSKLIWLILSVFLVTNCKTKRQISLTSDSEEAKCIIEDSPIKFIDKDAIYSLIEKKEIPNLIRSLQLCDQKFGYSGNYKDVKFKMMIPNDMKSYQFELGNNKFSYQFYTNDEHYSSSITIYYDFLEINRAKFFKQIEEGRLQVEIEDLNGLELYLFKNWKNKNCGKIFLENKQSIMYCSSDSTREEELKKIMSTFERL